MTGKLSARALNRLLAELPHFIEVALARYSQLIGREPRGDLKTLSAHHATCKAALGHLEILVRLLRAAAHQPATTRSTTPDVSPEVRQLAAEARLAIRQLEQDSLEDKT